MYLSELNRQTKRMSGSTIYFAANTPKVTNTIICTIATSSSLHCWLKRWRVAPISDNSDNDISRMASFHCQSHTSEPTSYSSSQSVDTPPTIIRSFVASNMGPLFGFAILSCNPEPGGTRFPDAGWIRERFASAFVFIGKFIHNINLHIPTLTGSLL